MENGKRNVGFVLDEEEYGLLKALNDAAAHAVVRSKLPLKVGQGVFKWNSAIFAWCLKRAAPELSAKLASVEDPASFPF